MIVWLLTDAIVVHVVYSAMPLCIKILCNRTSFKTEGMGNPPFLFLHAFFALFTENCDCSFSF